MRYLTGEFFSSECLYFGFSSEVLDYYSEVGDPSGEWQMVTRQQSRVRFGVQFALFSTSYAPLFVLIAVRQMAANREYLHFGGVSAAALRTFMSRFGFSAFLLTLALLGAVSLLYTLQRFKTDVRLNGSDVEIIDVRNRNSESISYIGTYIIPFLFEDYDDLWSVLSVMILLLVIYCIYVNSTLLLINPVLNIWYSLYEVEFVDSTKKGLQLRPRNGMIVSAHRFLQEGDRMLFKDLGSKLYFAEEYVPAAPLVGARVERTYDRDRTSDDPALSDFP
jgi:hypothetical protein